MVTFKTQKKRPGRFSRIGEAEGVKTWSFVNLGAEKSQEIMRPGKVGAKLGKKNSLVNT